MTEKTSQILIFPQVPPAAEFLLSETVMITHNYQDASGTEREREAATAGTSSLLHVEDSLMRGLAALSKVNQRSYTHTFCCLQ